MFYSDTFGIKNNKESQHASNKKLLNNVPMHSMRLKTCQHEKQLTETHTIIYHKETKRLIAEAILKNPDAKKGFVIKRVAQKVWENFCLHGQDSHVLRHLYSVIRKEHNRDLQFRYPPENIKILILEKKDNSMMSVSHNMHMDMINRAWQISQEVVSSCAH